MVSPVVPFVTSSAVIEQPVDVVWEAVQIHNFEKWYGPVAKSYKVPNDGSDMEIVRWEFNETIPDAACDFEIVARDKINHVLSYYVLSAPQPLKYIASASSIRLYPITHGEHKGHTFLQYTGEYATDATPSIIENGIFVRNDAIDGLQKFLEQSKTGQKSSKTLENIT